jgi:hypothetical protein
MVPVEPISLSIGAVALASLFSTCLECFNYFEAAKTVAWDLDLLLVKLDCEREKLLTWGDIVGIFKSTAEGRNPALDSKNDLIQRCLNSLESLVSNSDNLQRKYGVRRSPSQSSTQDRNDALGSNRMERLRKTFQHLKIQSLPTDQTALLKTKWAIHDKAKFETLISHIKDIVSNLHGLVPILPREQEMMAHRDIASLSVSNLRRVQRACNGTSEYQSWSDVAS